MRMARVVILKLFIGFGFLKLRSAMFPKRNRAADMAENELGHFHGRFQVSNPFRMVGEFSGRDSNSCGCASRPRGFRCLTSLRSSFSFQSTGCCRLTLNVVTVFLSCFHEPCGDSIGVFFIAFVIVEKEGW